MSKIVVEQDVTHRFQPHLVKNTTLVTIAGEDLLLLREMRRALLRTGYDVTVVKCLSGLSADMDRQAAGARGRSGAELLVVECLKSPWAAMAEVEAVRERYPSLPVIVAARFDAELREETRRLAVDFALTSPPNLETLCRIARELAPVIPEVEEDALD